MTGVIFLSHASCPDDVFLFSQTKPDQQNKQS